MVSNVSSGSKKTPPNIRTPSVHSPVLVSPISVAHHNKMLDSEGGTKSSSNWMRDQWVANLKKKQMNGGGSGVVSGVQVTSSVVPSRGSSSNTGGRTTKSGGRSTSRRNNNNQQQQQQQQQQQNMTIPPFNSHSFDEKDNLGLTHPAMFFNDLGCFEIESQSFMHLAPSTHEFDHLLPTSDDGSMISNSGFSVNLQPPVTTTATTTTKSRSGGGSKKNSAKPVPKKRTKCSALDLNQPKPRTPRRKLNCGNAFEDYQDTEVSTTSSTPQCFSSVGTPSNFNAEMSRMWGHDLDFSASSFVDTFLDLPTPKSAEMPTTTTSMGGHQSQQQSQYQSSSSSVHVGESPLPSSSCNGHQQLDDDLGLPKLIRTTSIEQEGLSHFFEQTTLGGGGDNNSSPSAHHPSNNNITDLYQMGGRQAPGHPHHQIKKNQIDLGSVSGPYSQAAMGAVDECFSKMMPSPHAAPAPRRNSLLGSLGLSAAAQFNSLSRLFSSTPRNGQGQGNLRTPRGPSGEYNFDHKNMPEFETLLDEYKFTDIDQELDSFYLDTIESFGGDLDLISN